MATPGTRRWKAWKANRWRQLAATTGGRCAYCGERPATTHDHVRPKSRGGTGTATNLVPACDECNTRKGDRLFSSLETAKRWLTVTKTLGLTPQRRGND